MPVPTPPLEPESRLPQQEFLPVSIPQEWIELRLQP